jgi:hypothetical protein
MINKPDTAFLPLSPDAHLASIHSRDENTFILNMSVALVSPIYYTTTWLDGQDTVRNDWRYSDGTDWNYTNWGPDQPDDDGGKEHCLTMVGPVRASNLKHLSCFSFSTCPLLFTLPVLVPADANYAAGQWNDFNCDPETAYKPTNYVCKLRLPPSTSTSSTATRQTTANLRTTTAVGQTTHLAYEQFDSIMLIIYLLVCSGLVIYLCFIFYVIVCSPRPTFVHANQNQLWVQFQLIKINSYNETSINACFRRIDFKVKFVINKIDQNNEQFYEIRPNWNDSQISATRLWCGPTKNLLSKLLR